MQIDAGQRGRKLPQIGGRSADLARELPKAPMRRRNGLIRAGKDERQALGIGAVRLDMDEGGFDDAGPAALGSIAHCGGQFAERQEALVIRAREPFRGYAADALAAIDIHLVATAQVTAGV